jgi:hypothetical protein
MNVRQLNEKTKKIIEKYQKKSFEFKKNNTVTNVLKSNVISKNSTEKQKNKDQSPEIKLSVVKTEPSQPKENVISPKQATSNYINFTKRSINIKQIQTIPNISRIVGAVAVQVSNVLILDKMIEYFLNDLGIVFYTNMVNYPNVLSAQVLPQPLKMLAIARLINVQERLEEFKLIKEHPMLLELTKGQILGIQNYLLANDQSDKWHDCIDFNRKLDATRNQSFTDVTPEFKPYV